MKQNKNKTITKLKTYFLMINLVLSIIAFSGFISAEEVGPDASLGDPTADIEIPDGINTNQPAPALDPTPRRGVTINRDSASGTKTISVDGRRKSVTAVMQSADWTSVITKAGLFAGIGSTVGTLAGGDDGALWGAVAGAAGGAVAGLLEKSMGPKAYLIGAGVSAGIFILTYKKSSEELVEFHCLPWQAPIGGDDCVLCNEFEECSEYTCKSLGQACGIINTGTKEEKCVWLNPHDVNSPLIEFKEVNKGLIFKPDNSLRPPATGVIIERENQKCIQAFTPLEFSFITGDLARGIGEPAQCKIDYNLTTGFEEMEFFVGGDSLFRYNHTEKLSLPGPDAINAIAPELENDGTYTLFIRCQDANGNFNQDAYSVSFCVDKGPDTTPPKIVDVNIPSGNPVIYDKVNLNLEVYVNEPSECKWDREDRDFENMANEMNCNLNVWDMNNQNVYTCKTDLTGIENRKENKYYFRCKDKPWAETGDRNPNTQSYLYTVIGTQPLNILDISPVNESISGATDVIPVFLEIITDNGYDNGESLCYYHQGQPSADEDYILFSETKSNIHKQRQDLPGGDYTYYLKCVDLGGNTVYRTTSFTIETDREGPLVVRTYREGGELKIITSEKSACAFSTNDCNFEIEEGIEMSTFDLESHTAEWITNQKYYIRCKDNYENQPYPNTCSIILRPADSEENAGVILL
jgi:hypothetical protein